MSDELTATAEELAKLRKIADKQTDDHAAALRARDERIAELSVRLDNANATIRYLDERSTELKGEVERLAWNLAGCLTIAEAERPKDFNPQMATPALVAVNALAAKLSALTPPSRQAPLDNSQKG
jgi:uncharacterized coiled-coil protein SlyX